MRVWIDQDPRMDSLLSVKPLNDNKMNPMAM